MHTAVAPPAPASTGPLDFRQGWQTLPSGVLALTLAFTAATVALRAAFNGAMNGFIFAYLWP